ncbi:hypothetical protein [Streptomyces sp. WMMB303]|uniref:hypothetical protein n=1 Tax=Streptomyces sp. WMMB303 TaxID=3034154 RepID=UPI0023ED621E|nr:hypothetical protein [Streptomyces sp. WMMB303]MDF4250450.1 hypothetical protein [Streptomyces sp. WMMB303]
MNEDYDQLTDHDVMSTDEMAAYDRDTEFALDAADEARAHDEQRIETTEPDDPDECAAEFIDGTWDGTFCGCQDCHRRAYEATEG